MAVDQLEPTNADAGVDARAAAAGAIAITILVPFVDLLAIASSPALVPGLEPAAIAFAITVPLHVWIVAAAIKGERVTRGLAILGVLVVVHFIALVSVGPGWVRNLSQLVIAANFVLPGTRTVLASAAGWYQAMTAEPEVTKALRHAASRRSDIAGASHRWKQLFRSVVRDHRPCDPGTGRLDRRYSDRLGRAPCRLRRICALTHARHTRSRRRRVRDGVSAEHATELLLVFRTDLERHARRVVSAPVSGILPDSARARELGVLRTVLEGSKP
jgi:hypothetical protein